MKHCVFLSACCIFESIACSLKPAQKVGGPVDNQTRAKPSASYSQSDRQNTVDTAVTASYRIKPVTHYVTVLQKLVSVSSESCMFKETSHPP